MRIPTTNLDRRRFLKTSVAGGAGLLIGFYLPAPGEMLAAPAISAPPAALNAWIHIGTDDIVTIVIDKSEMGQGIMTGLAMLAAEELECDWENIRTEFAPNDKVYFNPIVGFQGTGASSSTRGSWEPMRKAGATARQMLIDAAAQKWGVDKSECRAENGAVLHARTSRRFSYGSLAESAAKILVPKDVPLKDSKQYRIIGKPRKRLDTPDKVNGKAAFGIDARVPGMLYATVVHCPVFGGKVSSFDAAKAKAVPGVRDVVQISSGIAVVADNTWTAMEGRRALEITWDEGPNSEVSSDAIRKLFADRVTQPGAIARTEGDAQAVLAGAANKIEAVYEAPFLAHATMEPMNCTAHVRADGCEIWAPTQWQTSTQNTAAKIAGVPPESVLVHTTYLGGGFGRRGEQDFIRDAVEVSKAIAAPVKVTWSREEDMQHDFYRPASYCRFTAGLDADGWPIAWTNRIACSSIFNRIFPGSVKNNIDRGGVEGCADLPYAIPNILVDYQLTETGIPVGLWRSVGYSQNGFFTESFIDEVAAAGRKDPYELRRRLLANSPRHLAVLELAAQKAGWGKPLPEGRFHGIAVVSSHATYVAEVAEVSVNRSAGTVKVHRVVCSVDGGRITNPDTITAQMQSAIVFGLTAALKGSITIARGRVEQSNFNNYQLLRMDEMPVVEVHILETENLPGGIGEPAVPPIAPAVCNAIFAATGKRIRRLPIRATDFA